MKMKDFDVFLSVVVPCYNSGPYIEPLLQSIVDCEMDDIEVILSDDCSTEDYQNKVDKFKDKLNIIQCRMPYNSGNPTNARELGVTKASGMYITFMDHDDLLIPEGIKMFKKFAEAYAYPSYVVCGFQQRDMNDNIERDIIGYLDFLHGKFFRLDDFWRKYDIHYNKDIFHKEDTWVLAQVNCLCIRYDIKPKFTKFCTHVWHNNEKSLGHWIGNAENSGRTDVTIERIKTLIEMDKQIYFKHFDEGGIPLGVARHWFLEHLIGIYWDVQLYHECFEELKPILIDYYKEVIKRIKMDIDRIIKYVSDPNNVNDKQFKNLFEQEYYNFAQFAHPQFQITERFTIFLKILENGGGQ